MVYCLEDYHDMRDHERHGKLYVLDFFEYDLDESQSLVVVEEELELPLENGYTLFEKCMIPLTWNQPIRKVLHFLGRCILLSLCILHMTKMFHFMVIWVS